VPAATTTGLKKQLFFPSNAYVAYTLDNGLAFGIGFFSPFGLGTEWPAEWDGRRIALKTDIRTFFINPTVAYRINEQLSIGAGASYVFTDVKLKYRTRTYSTLTPPTPAAYDGTASLEADGNAFNFNVGLLYKPLEDLSIGLSYRHSTNVDYSGQASFKDMQALSPWFPGGEGKTTIELPNTFFGGVAYTITPDVTVEADLQYTGWACYDVLQIDIATGPAAPAALGGGPLQKSPAPAMKDWKNVVMVRVGGEYRADPFAFRAGFIYDQTPQPDKSVEPMLPDANRVEFTLGLGYRITPAINADVAYQFILFSDRSVAAPTNAFPGTYATTANLFGLNLGYSF
jgi:long-chain fatty acid transport protein